MHARGHFQLCMEVSVVGLKSVPLKRHNGTPQRKRIFLRGKSHGVVAEKDATSKVEAVSYVCCLSIIPTMPRYVCLPNYAYIMYHEYDITRFSGL